MIWTIFIFDIMATWAYFSTPRNSLLNSSTAISLSTLLNESIIAARIRFIKKNAPNITINRKYKGAEIFWPASYILYMFKTHPSRVKIWKIVKREITRLLKDYIPYWTTESAYKSVTLKPKSPGLKHIVP